ncbi:MAG: PVC-type heme-binding CxxCH protein [Limisphaerales bacterium]
MPSLNPNPPNHRLRGLLLLGWLGLAWLVAVPVQAADRFELKDGDRVVFLGDTFFEREGDYGGIEMRLTAAFPDRGVTFRNLAWSGDTPMGRARASFDWGKTEIEWLKRVKEQLALVRPTVAFLSYGMTAALEGGEAGVAKHVEDLGRLMDAVEEVSGAPVRFVLLGPLPHRPLKSGRDPQADLNNRALHAVQEATRKLAGARGAAFAGFNVPAVGPTTWDINPTTPSPTEDGVTPNEWGNELAAQNFVRLLVTPGTLAVGPRAEEELLRSAIREKNAQFFHRWRPANWTYLFGFRKHEQGRNAVEIPKFEPLVEEWDGRIARLRDLKNQDPRVVSELRGILEARSAGQSGPAARSGGGESGRRGGTDLAAVAPQPVPEFEVDGNLEVTLWAENPLLFKPIQINWDPQGRLWAASSRVYPQIRPGQEAEDSVVVLEDVDGDGRAEKSTVFADGLLIPTAVVPDGKGGCYVGASHQLLHLEDTDGDGRADKKTIVLSSFGTEDTHHNLHTLRWGYDGHLYMNQSIYTHTHVETPWGVRRLNSAGIWRFHPETWHFDVLTKGGCNPWGHHWDQYGEHFFTDGAGGKGIYHAMEGATYFTYADMRREADSISPGNYPKFCSLEIVHSPAFPAEWQGQFITCDFRAHRIVRFGRKVVGSTFQTVEMPDVLRTANVTFRPIDLRFGPDGALYIADWSNPIIQHGEVDFRDPRRDKEHGRIWRVAAKGGKPDPTANRNLSKLTTEALLSLTLSANGWDQEQARLVLRQRAASEVLAAVDKWLPKQEDPRAALEAMWLNEAFEQTPNALVGRLVSAADPRHRAAAARQLAR